MHADGWHMEGCPVNGPSIAADGDDVVLGWFTAANDEPRVQLARSGTVARISARRWCSSAASGSMARSRSRWTATTPGALGLREEFGGASLWLAAGAGPVQGTRTGQGGDIEGARHRRRLSQAPLLRDGTAYIVWTDSDGTLTQLQGARVRAETVIVALWGGIAATWLLQKRGRDKPVCRDRA